MSKPPKAKDLNTLQPPNHKKKRSKSTYMIISSSSSSSGASSNQLMGQGSCIPASKGSKASKTAKGSKRQNIEFDDSKEGQLIQPINPSKDKKWNKVAPSQVVVLD
jgi:hypothetical protein